MTNISQSQLMKVILKAVAKTYYAEIVKNTPGKGIVADAWDINIEGNSVVVSNNEFGNIIKFLEDGTKAHIIRAKNKKFLKFKKPEGGKKSSGPKIPGNIAFEKDGYIYAKAVRHPGTAARQFIAKVLENSKITKAFQKEIEKGLGVMIEAKIKKNN